MFGSPEAVIAAPAGEIAAAIKVPLSVGRGVVKSGRSPEKAEKLLSRLSRSNARMVSLWDDEYPSRLKNITDPPIVIYINGDSSPLYDYSVAVVGTRAASDHSKGVTLRIAQELAAAGVTVVSGMALGIDSIAHEGALRAGGRTIAVLGSGIDVIYPPSNRKLYERIITQGMVVSEYPPGLEPNQHHFPQRNRIISGLSLGVVVVEAGLKSGALITGKLALDQGRELFAVPGAAGLPRSAGVNRLLKDGTAIFVEKGKDILDHLRSQLAPVLNVSATLSLPKLEANEAAVYNLLESGPLLIDELIRKSSISVIEMNRLLTVMQLKGLIHRLAGARIGRA
ncbi:MAG: DNA-processing protein DprA [Candidatus Hatepunaea meridiana]|nr:DNA-processing protein DprA [Candidatus Hatepunaea meridiana]